jgi:hypothetical protein
LDPFPLQDTYIYYTIGKHERFIELSVAYYSGCFRRCGFDRCTAGKKIRRRFTKESKDRELPRASVLFYFLSADT